tara:strand:- start:320 stop:910 length:591 start_codon:yes stop_codon:yes gene_type:complete
MKFLLVLPLFLISLTAQAEEYSAYRLSFTEEQDWRQKIDSPEMYYLREFINDCLDYTETYPQRKRTDPIVIGMPCEPHADSRVGSSMQEIGINRFRGRFLVLDVKPLWNDEEAPENSAQWFYNSSYAQWVYIMFDQAPFPVFAFTQIFLYSTPEDKSYENMSLMHMYEFTPNFDEETHKRIVEELTYYLRSDEWTL